MKIGILGGTFDPVHKAHIEIAKVASSKLKLDKVIFIPNSVPPDKDKTYISGEHKLSMLEVAIKGCNNFETDRFEIDNKGPSYLYLTLEYLNKKYPLDELYFLAGADNIPAISGWKNPHLIFKYANIVFITRPRYVLDLNIVNKLKEKFSGKISFVEFEGVDISSTKIREDFEKLKEVKQHICDDVYSYITDNALYPSEVINKLSGMLSEKRMIHVKNVAKEAYKLAKHYKENCEKAYYAGLLHDCAKNLDYDYQIELISKFSDYELMENELSYPKVIHALSGTVVANKIFGVTDKTILDAIRYHTLGNIKMSLFDKIIYIADLISEDRNYKGVEILKEMAYNNIDKAILMSIENTICYLGDKRIQPDVLKLKEYIKEKSDGCTH